VAAVSNRQQIPAIYSQFFDNAFLGYPPAPTAQVQPAAQPQPVAQAAPIVQPVPQPLPEREARQPAPPREPREKKDPEDLSLDGSKVFSVGVYPKLDLLGFNGDKTGVPIGIGITINFNESYKNYGETFYFPNSFFFSAETAMGDSKVSGLEKMAYFDGRQRFYGAGLGLGALYKIRLGTEQRFIAHIGPSFQLYIFQTEKDIEYDGGSGDRLKIDYYENHVLPGAGINTGLSFRFNRLISMDLGLNFKAWFANDEKIKSINDVYISNPPWGGDSGFYSGYYAKFGNSLDFCLGIKFWWPR